jgi:predicted flap endonuclease-1-like 5' DNA nuclease
MSQFVIIRNSRTGAEKRVSAKTWELMPKSQKKEYGVVGKVLDKAKPEPTARMRSENSFIPPEIEEATREKEHEAKEKAESIMISGEALDEAPAPTANGAEATEANQKEAPKGDNLTVISGLTAKTAEVLQGIGVTTFKQLASAPKAKLAEALNAANLQAKAAQVPNWQAKATELSK